MRKLIFYLFASLFFLIPLVLWPFTSEVFEFNKIVLVYSFTVLISTTWLTRSVLVKKIVFRRTILDIPLLIFLGSQLISTFLSIDFYTSVFGYYSRFNGGLLSSVCYALLYWAFVSNLGAIDVKKLINFSLLPSAFLVSVYAVLEHYGIDKNIWVQDVQSRVFSTLGQPNWLAAWIGAIIPITWALIISKYHLISDRPNREKYSFKLLIYILLFVLFFVTLLFTKSRSGLLGFLTADIVFWGLYLWQSKNEILKRFAVPFFVIHSLLFICCLIIGTQWTPSLNSILNNSTVKPSNIPIGTSLDTGGTESGTIRKIVWKGAIDTWKNYPIFGTGVETFAYSYYGTRPVAHNLTSEWDFIYNKAHNQFLNYAANSGTVGLFSYLILIVIAILQILNVKFSTLNLDTKTNNYLFQFALLAGFISLSVSNFFGFSVVPTDLQFFLFPAFALVLSTQQVVHGETYKIEAIQKILVCILLLFTFYFLFLIARYWYADILYAKAKAHNSTPRPDLAIPLIDRAINSQPYQSNYYIERGIYYSSLAMAYDKSDDTTNADRLLSLAINDIQKVMQLSPNNVNLRRQIFGVYVRLSTIQEDYLKVARNILAETITLAPTDPKLLYNLGIADANLGKTQEAADDFKKAIEYKPNYIDARIQYAALLAHLNNKNDARFQLEYILTNLDPTNETAKRALADLK